MKESIQIHEEDMGYQSQAGLSDAKLPNSATEVAVTLLTGGGDKPYAFGLATELISKGANLDVIGSDELDCPEFHGKPGVNFLNLRGDQRPDVSFVRKVLRVSMYYARLIRYAVTARPRIFHILWNNKLELFDRTLLMLYYKALGKKIVLTVHNVNSGKRDSKDSVLNRFTLKVQYRLADHIFVHTKQMKLELFEEFGVYGDRVTVIPFGINNAVPNTRLTPAEARERLGIGDTEKVILFFGNIAPYKGLEYLITAFQRIQTQRDNYQLIVAGWPKNCERYWTTTREAIREDVRAGRVLLRADYIPDDETEIYFKAADVLVLPYRHVYQSGVLFLGYSFGLPAIAADVGSLKDEIVEGKTGFVFRPRDPVELAKTIERYFASDLYAQLSVRRQEIRDFAIKQHSWDVVGQATLSTYASLLRIPYPANSTNRDELGASLNVKAPHEAIEKQSGPSNGRERRSRGATCGSKRRIPVIPKVLHYCFGMSSDEGAKPWSLVHYVCLRSAIERIKPTDVLFYFEKEPTGPWWELSRGLVTLERIEAPREIFGNAVVHYAHRADIVRLEMLLRRGGIYLDADVFVHGPFDRLLGHSTVLGKQVVDERELGLCNAVILAEPQAPFLKRWHAEYRSFRSKGHDAYWDEHSVQIPYQLSKKFPDEITVLPPFAFFWPTFKEADLTLIFDSSAPIDLSRAYATHLWESLAWERYLEHLTPRRVRRVDTNFHRWTRPLITDLSDDFGAPTVTARFARGVRQLKRRVRSAMPL